jgi:biopolymer transport protein TolQ
VPGLSSLGSFGEILADIGPLEKVVLVVLLVMSVVSWAIILHKALQFRLITSESARFLKTYRESRRFSLVASGAKRLRQSPLGRVYLSAYQELLAGGAAPPDVMDGAPEPGEEGISTDRLESVQRAMRRVHASEIERMERYLAFLATTASAGPFIGLFGTVIGIITAFQGMAVTGSGGLGAVSAGIAEALGATALGLFVAVPAVWLYNYFLNKVERFQVEMSNSSSQLVDYFIKNEARARARV